MVELDKWAGVFVMFGQLTRWSWTEIHLLVEFEPRSQVEVVGRMVTVFYPDGSLFRFQQY